MSEYSALHAAHYDLVYRDKPYREEARFVAARLSEHGVPAGRLLDLACGTGRHALEFADLGYAVTGVDINNELLGHACRNAEERGSAVRFVAQDMRRLDLADERFDAVTCLFDSIGFPLTRQAILATLRGVRSQLLPTGVFAVEFLHAPAMLREAEPVRVGRWQTRSDGELLRVAETKVDGVSGQFRVRYELVELRADGRYRHGVETQCNRYFGVEEMALLLEAAGLKPVTFIAAYDSEATVRDSTWHVLALARR